LGEYRVGPFGAWEDNFAEIRVARGKVTMRTPFSELGHGCFGKYQKEVWGGEQRAAGILGGEKNA